jgi:morphogenetic protein associated with SpoVID
VKIHIVQKGDTLWIIAKKYGVDFEELKKLNSQLSNPDMIMPGMKVKVPTAGGSIVKDVGSVKKEIPQATHPFAQQLPPTLPVQKEIIKEVPKKETIIHKKETIYTPKMPQPVIPEIDINNYYMMNMAQIQQSQVPPYIPPTLKEKEIESIEYPEAIPIMPVQEECYEMYPSYMMPGVPDCGCDPNPYPYPNPYQYQYPYTSSMPSYGMPTQGMMPYQGTEMPMPQPGQWMHHDEDESSSSSMPMMQHYQAGAAVDGNVPYQPSYQPQAPYTNVIQQGFDLGGRQTQQELQHMLGQQGYPGGQQYMGGQYPGGQHLGGQYMGGQYPGGQHMGGQHMGGQYPGGQHMGGQHMGGQYPGGQHMGGQLMGGQYPGGQHMGGQHMGGHYPGGQHMGGQHIGGQ